MTRTKEIRIIKTPVERVELGNRQNKNTITAFESLDFYAEVYPSAATVRDVTYSVDSSAAAITADGVLTVREGTPIGTVVTVTCRAADDPGKNDEFKVTVAAVPVKSVRLVGPESFKVTESAKLICLIDPNYATEQTARYTITYSDAPGATVDENGVLRTSLPGTIRVKAIVDGVESNELTIEAQKEPVVSLTFGCADYFKVTESLALNARALPIDATYPAMTYEISDTTAFGARIIDGVLYADGLGFVTVRVSADGISSEKEIEVKKEPVTSVIMSATDREGRENECWQFSAQVFPENATFRRVTYRVTEGNAVIDANGLLEISKDAPIDSVVVVVAAADGVSAEYRIRVTIGKIKAESVALSCFDHELMQGASADLYVATTPAVVSNPQASFTVDGEASILVQYDSELNQYRYRVAIGPDAPVGSTVKISASVDGVECDRPVEITVLAVPVESLTFTNEKEIKTSETVELSAIVAPSNATYRNVVYAIVENKAGASLNGTVLSATVPGTVIVRASAGGKSVTQTITVNEEQVTGIAVQFSSQDKSFKVTETLAMKYETIPGNATYRTVAVAIVSQSEGVRASIAGNYLRAQGVGTVTLKFSAANGITRTETVTVKKEPVTSVAVDGSTVKTLVDGETRALSVAVLPEKATNRSVRYEVLSFTNGLKIELKQESGTWKISVRIQSDVLTSGAGIMVIKAISSDDESIYCSWKIEVSKRAVTSVGLSAPTSMTDGGTIRLGSTVAPSKATYTGAVYRVSAPTGIIYRLNGSSLTVTIDPAIWDYGSQATVTIYAEADGVKSEVHTVSVEIRSNTTIAFTNLSGGSVEQGKSLQYGVTGLDGTYRAVNYKLAFEEDGQRKTIDVASKNEGEELSFTNAKNSYFTMDANGLTVKLNAPVGKTFTLTAVCAHEPNVAVSVSYTVSSSYAKDFQGLSVQNQLLKVDASSEYKTMTGYTVSVSNGSELSFTKEIAGNASCINFRLYQYAKLGNYTISVRANFSEEYAGSDGKPRKNDFSIDVVDNQSYAGTKYYYSSQISDYNGTLAMGYPTIAVFDLYNSSSVSYVSTIKGGANLQALYIYGGTSAPCHTNLRVYLANYAVGADLYLNRIDFRAPTGNNAIETDGSGQLNMHILGTVYARGGYAGFAGTRGINAASGTLNISGGGTLWVYGSDGVDGSDGISYSRVEKNGGSGTAPSGGYGGNGAVWGIGLYANNLILASDHGVLNAYGGRGGNGGCGGNGSGSDREGRPRAGDGGDGGHGGDGGAGIHVAGMMTWNMNAFSVTAVGGAGGYGGDGGHGGHGVARHYSDQGGNGGRGGSVSERVRRRRRQRRRLRTRNRGIRVGRLTESILSVCVGCRRRKRRFSRRQRFGKRYGGQ